ncbi:alpha beta-hydrolase [Pyrenophora seminiperda CCB06]|uniref:Alpha beta-hydrolase n=1 Tax=Pyrenophora seminiperda CCB06 TaxID=1302712 RepID=A0A3M7M8E8_9PLEO|nr:alpha beta-hydrolase [Pyrenophora seminiperda CCB06]
MWSYTVATALIALLWQVEILTFGYGGDRQPRRDFFYVGGEYANLTFGNSSAQFMINQIYVEKHTPAKQKQKHPIVFIHGSGQTGTNFLETPDGRPGWASYFLSHGYTVYLSDQPSRGRSPWFPSLGTMYVFTTAQIEQLFTATSLYKLWPQAKLHTQWPGTGRVGDATFDAFYATQVQLQADNRLSEEQNGKAYTALLDKIGEEAHIITHSQSGAYGWRVADQRPHLVKSVVALEPSGPPFVSKMFGTTGGPARPWGITDLEMTYDPPAGPNATDIKNIVVAAKDANHSECVMQDEPAKQLVNLARIPVLAVTSEASYHAQYDYCTVGYMRQAGVDVEHVELAKEGIHGNGHMFFMEKNNLEIAERVLTWLEKH